MLDYRPIFGKIYNAALQRKKKKIKSIKSIKVYDNRCECCRATSSRQTCLTWTTKWKRQSKII